VIYRRSNDKKVDVLPKINYGIDSKTKCLIMFAYPIHQFIDNEGKTRKVYINSFALGNFSVIFHSTAIVIRRLRMKLIVFVTLCVALGVNSSPIDGEEEFSPYIINGVRAPVAPYYVYIEYFNAANLGFFGGGALISNRHILTTATNVVG
jgi:hypothetical protein